MKITTDMIDNPIRFASCTIATRNGWTTKSYDYVVANWVGPVNPGDLVLGTPAENVNTALPNLLRVEHVYDETAIPASSFFATNRVVDGGLIVAKVDNNQRLFWKSAVSAVAQSRLREGLEPAAKVIEHVQLTQAVDEPTVFKLPRHPTGKGWTPHAGTGVPTIVRGLVPGAEITFVEFCGRGLPPLAWSAAAADIDETRWKWTQDTIEHGSIIAYTIGV